MSRITPQRFGQRDALILLLLCAGAYLGNYLAVPLFTGVDLLFGGVAVMLAALHRSLVEVLVVAVIGSLPTLVLWGHPYALIIFVAEAAVVHCLYARWQQEITLYDTAFWLIVGVPLVLFFYGQQMGMGAVATGLIALKQPVNGLLYTAVALVVHHAVLLRGRWGRATPIPRARVANLLAPVLLVFALVPALVVLSVYSQVERHTAMARLAEQLDVAGRYLDMREAGDEGLQAAVEHWHGRLEPPGLDAFAVALVDGAGAPIAEAPPAWLSERTSVRAVVPGLAQHYAGDTGTTMTRERGSYYTHRMPGPSEGDGAGVDLVVGTAAAPYVDHLRTLQLAALALACGIGVGGVVGAGTIARRTGRLLDPLIARLQRVPANVRDGTGTAWPEVPVAELAELTDGIRDVEAELVEHVRALAESRGQLAAITANLPGGVYQRVMEPDGRVHFTYLSANFEDVYGIDPVRGQTEPELVFARIHPEDRPAYHAALQRSARTLAQHDIEFRFRLPSGEARWLRALGQPRAGEGGAIIWDGIAIDETARKQAESELEFLARYDTLTGLLNREEIVRQLASLLRDAGARQRVAVLYVDLDHVKSVNDSLGHAAGDRVIREAATRIQAAVREGDRVGRFGGDEFVVLAAGVRDREAAIAVARRILDGLDAPLQVEERPVEVSATIGILAQPGESDDADECLRKADVALYHAKHARRGTWSFYSIDMDLGRRRRLDLLADLRTALAGDHLFLEYQPKVELASGRMTGAEALVRWQHPNEGIIPPGWFIPLAEESGLIEELGLCVLRRACADLAAWCEQHPDAAPGHVSVNVSGRQLGSDTLWHAVWEELSRSGLAPGSLELEVTESVLYDAQAVVLERLTAAGVRLAIDDYGKGYSSLLVMRDSPAMVVKVDRAFVGSALTSESDRAIVESTIRLAHALGKYVVAEGVETAEQLEMLREMGCDAAQGFHLARPMPAAEIPAFGRLRW